MSERMLLLGNDAMAHGLVESGCSVVASYPGTPASEILSGVALWRERYGVPMHVEWAVNEKVAFEIAYAAAQSGLRAATAMKQVGLNVASDPFMSAAYLGVTGGFVVISADDPGPHSSQTEQDSRLTAMSAKVPVLDPDSPEQARELIAAGFELSEAFRVPVMLRPTTRVCHANQDILPGPVAPSERTAAFVKDPTRWAATPVFRHKLHLELEEKLTGIAAWEPTAPRLLNPGVSSRKALVASGVAAAHAREVLGDLGLRDVLPLWQVVQPYPLHTAFVERLLADYDEILVLEETTGVMELQLADRHRVKGKRSGFVPEVGELSPELVERLVAAFAGIPAAPSVAPPTGGGRRPTLCPGCPHRASFHAIKRAAPKGIYPSDIGCYTLGLNLGGVDTVLCMGAAVSQAAGFYHAYKLSGQVPDIVATIGDSTFFHAGIPPLIDAVVQDARFVLVILDNATTAMTGNQPTPALGWGAGGVPTATVDMEGLIKACGVRFCRVGEPGNLPAFTALMKEAVAFARTDGLAVVIARQPCVVDRTYTGERPPKRAVRVSDACNGCRFCTTQFECPALVYDEETKRVVVDTLVCSKCGVCVDVCPRLAIEEVGK
ncbi:thiamine pyrophosphate-dependent enzyme [Geobacter sulfurreducens]|uniref:thiamine pyrophosphate-dependent enzyme n=1 Tax=Geobacter sulfurreducens TaxID=35554 RepID=UPI002BC87AC8|nr:thiamine pyrophosphate-dependent enzyme [Geobacter sulfurreducens]HML77925.1 thiamine pyrophosphate-dependent enzyme [Geobacter sulfurreducens]